MHPFTIIKRANQEKRYAWVSLKKRTTVLSNTQNNDNRPTEGKSHAPEERKAKNNLLLP
jgi:chromatin remodeling complex protein RSC6